MPDGIRTVFCASRDLEFPVQLIPEGGVRRRPLGVPKPALAEAMNVNADAFVKTMETWNAAVATGGVYGGNRIGGNAVCDFVWNDKY